MLDPSQHQRAVDKLTAELRKQLVDRHNAVFTSLRTSWCSDAGDNEALKQVLPRMALVVGFPQATSLEELVDYDLAQRAWAIELGVKERWDVDVVLVKSDQTLGLEKNLAEGRDPNTDRLELAKAAETAAGIKLTELDQRLAGLAQELSKSLAPIRRLLGLPDNIPVKAVLARLDDESEGEFLNVLADLLEPKLRKVHGFQYDPTREELRAMVLALFNDV